MHISCTSAYVAGFFNCETWIHLNMIYNCSKISCIVIECQSDHEWFRLVQYTLTFNIFMTHLISGFLVLHLYDFAFQRFHWRLHLWNLFSWRKYVLMFLISLMWIILCDRIVTMLSKQILSIMSCDQCKRVISTRYPRVSFPSIYTIFKWLFLSVVIRYNMPI